MSQKSPRPFNRKPLRVIFSIRIDTDLLEKAFSMTTFYSDNIPLSRVLRRWMREFVLKERSVPEKYLLDGENNKRGDKDKKYSLKVEPELLKDAKDRASELGYPLSVVLRAWIRLYADGKALPPSEKALEEEDGITWGYYRKKE